MKIYYDGFVYTFQKAGGINRYFASVISRLPAHCTPIISSTWFTDMDLNLPTHPSLQHIVAKCGPMRPYRFFYKYNQAYFARKVSHIDFDVAHPSYYHLITGREISDFKKPIVLTVYDMLHEKFAHLMGPTQQHVPEQKRKAINAASLILCISENTRRDLLEFYQLPEERVRVTYLASELNATQINEAMVIPDAPFFLFVGSRATYKNFGMTLHCLSRLRVQHPQLLLCIVGPPLTDEENAQIEALKLAKGVQFLGQVEDGHLAKLYRDSLALVYPSLYEGFGIPPLEAMACGGLAITSNRSSLPEVVGSAGLLFDPDDPNALYEIMRKVAENQVSRSDLIINGKQQASLFSWDKTAQDTYQAYQSLV